LDEAWIAQAKVGTVGVDAPPIQTHVLVFALVLVVALVGVGVARLTFRTLASERTNRIDAVATGAQVRDGFALVDIWTKCQADSLLRHSYQHTLQFSDSSRIQSRSPDGRDSARKGVPTLCRR
jgi:hypothetical protein